MKRFMNLMGVVLVLSAVATASTVGGNPEVLVSKNSFGGSPIKDVSRGRCDPIEHLVGLCKSSQDFLQEN